MKKFVIVNKQSDKSKKISTEFKSKILSKGWIEDKENPEYVICIGGDGTLLYGVHSYLEKVEQVKFLAIHTGTLGFFTDYTENEIDECINDLVTKEPTIVEANLIETNVYGNDNKTYYALNEVRIENIIKTQILDVSIDNQFFETFRGTGLCISTQSGSTAYNRSLKGAVIDTNIRCLQLSEITGIHHSLYHSLGSSLVLNQNRIITLRSNTFDEALLCYDHKHTDLINAEYIEIKLSNSHVKFARFRNYSYTKRLRNLY